MGCSVRVQGPGHRVESEAERAAALRAGVEPWPAGQHELFVRITSTLLPGAGPSRRKSDCTKAVITMKSTVKDIMTKRVVAVRAGASFKEMASRLRQERVSAFPVIDDDGKVIGVVSEADLLPRETLDAGWASGIPEMTSPVLYRRDQEKAESVTAADLMTQPAVTAAPGDTVEQAARLMYVRRIKRLPVVDAQGHLVGIVSRADVLSVFDRLDVEIRKEITDEMILNEFRTDPDRLTVTVNGGIVTLEGSPETAELGHAIVARTRHVQGVVAVRDRLDYPAARPPLATTAALIATQPPADLGTALA